MIIFVIRNKRSNEYFVGSTRNNLANQWNKILCATKKNLDYPLYNSIKKYGENAFEIEEWDYADTREELISLEKEAIKLFKAKSLRGYKTSEFTIKKSKSNRKFSSVINAKDNYSNEVYEHESLLLKSRQIDNAIQYSYDDINDLDEEPLLEEDLKHIDKQLYKVRPIKNQANKEDSKKTEIKDIASKNVTDKVEGTELSNVEKITFNQATVVCSEVEVSNLEKLKELDKEQVEFITIVRQALSRHKKMMSEINKEYTIKRINKLRVVLQGLS
jgi:ribosomal protein S13